MGADAVGEVGQREGASERNLKSRVALGSCRTARGFLWRFRAGLLRSTEEGD
jgi:hypothetical protein